MVQKKNLLIATDDFYPRWDGIVRFLFEVVPELKKKFNITLIVPDFISKYPAKKEEEELFKYRFKDVRIVYFKTRKQILGDFSFAKTNKKILNNLIKKQDLVFINSLGTIGSNCLKIAKENNIKSAYFSHSFDIQLVENSMGSHYSKIFRKLVSTYFKKNYQYLDNIIVPYEQMIKSFKKLRIKSNFHVCKIGVDLTKFKPRNKSLIKKAFNIRDLSMGYCGRLAREKNISVLHETFLNLQKSFHNLKLLVLGDGIKKYRKYFEKTQGVRYFRNSINPETYYNAMDIFVLPSSTETTSLVTLEAMASGCVPVVSKVGFISKYIENDYNGILINISKLSKQEKVKIFEKNIRRLILNSKLREKLSKNAINTIRNNFDIKDTRKNLVNILFSIVKD